MAINYAQEFVKIAFSDVGKNGRTICNWYPLAWGEAWCAASCSYWANKLGQKYGVSILGKIIPKTAGAGCFAREGVPNGMGTWIPRGSRTPKTGDLITFRWGGWYSDKYHSDHVGIVQKVENGYVNNVLDLMKAPFDRPYKFSVIFTREEQLEFVKIINQIKDNAVIA